MRHPLPRLATALACLLLAACSQSSAGNSKVLRFSAIPDDNTTALKQRFDPLAARLSEVLGVEVEYVPMSSYTASVEAFKNGDIQLAWFGGLTGAQARAAVDGARALAQGKVDTHFKSYFIANASTGIERSAEFPKAMAGKSFTFGSDASPSGRLMPEHFVRENPGQAPEDFFSQVGFSGSHDKTAALVQAGTWDTGALNYKTYERMVADGSLDPELCRLVWVTPEYADYNWTAHPALAKRFGKDFIANLQEALVGIVDPALLAACDREEGLIEASNADFQAIHDLAAKLGFLR